MPIIIIIIAIIIIYFFISSNKNNKTSDKINLENLNKKEVEKLLMVDLSDYFKSNYKAVIEKHPKSKPVALKLTSSQNENNIYFDEEKYKKKHIIITTFYDEKTGKILIDNTIVYVCDEVDDTIIETFGDKELIVFS